MGSKPMLAPLVPQDKTLVGLHALLRDLEELQHDVNTCDVTFIVGDAGATFNAHSLILKARCHKFDASAATSGAPYTLHLPRLSAECFMEVLTYIYTARISLRDHSVFALLAIARQLGVSELSHHCEEYILSTLSAHNVCSFYHAARQLEHNDPEYSLRGDGFLSMCAAYIEENAEVCTRTDGWLQLDKEDLVDLISSENFSLEEEEVWRAVLTWAKYQAGISMDKDVKMWTGEERAAVGQALNGVIQHVKLLLIDSRVYAEEVEPTGAVPMELSLERYRFAAVPASYDQAEDQRFLPRVSHKLFTNTEILTGEKLQHQRLLNTWFGDVKQTWQLLYRASSDGYTAEAFHKRCDGHSPTYIIIQGSTGSVCGGFSDVPWTSVAPPRGKYIPSHKSFLFTLANHQGVPPTKFEVKNPKFATLHHPKFGPMFGAGADLCIWNGCDTGMLCYSNLPHTYSGEHASPAILMGDFNFNVTDYEVFTPSDTAPENVV